MNDKGTSASVWLKWNQSWQRQKGRLVRWNVLIGLLGKHLDGSNACNWNSTGLIIFLFLINLWLSVAAAPSGDQGPTWNTSAFWTVSAPINVKNGRGDISIQCVRDRTVPASVWRNVLHEERVMSLWQYGAGEITIFCIWSFNIDWVFVIYPRQNNINYSVF